MNTLFRQAQTSIWPQLQRYASSTLGQSSSGTLQLVRQTAATAAAAQGNHWMVGGSTAAGTTTFTRRSYHTTPSRQNPAEKKMKDEINRLFTDDLLAEMEYHHDRRDVTNLNLFLRHPSTPRIMGWHPDLILDAADNDMATTAAADPPLSISPVVPPHPEEVTASLSATTTQPKPVWRAAANTTSAPWSCMNRNARRPRKANKGKRPCSSVGRKSRTRKLGNPKRK